MSRPRKPFGATHPGRLPATMMKVLAAEHEGNLTKRLGPMKRETLLGVLRDFP